MTDSAATAIPLSELARRTGATLAGSGDVAIARVGTLERAGPGDIAFLANPRYRAQLAQTRASAVIVSPADASRTALPRLVSDNPYAVFAAVAQILHPAPAAEPGIDATARVHRDAVVAPSASVGPYAVVEARARIGARARVGAHGIVGADASIGDDVVLHPRVTLYPRTVIGARSIVHSGAVLGADGFGMAEAEGRWLKIPQAGRVVIGADCEIGANTTVDRGAIDDTVIEDDVKLDNQIQIGHNCFVGAHTAIAGCVGIAGSTRIGRNCKIGGAAMISGHLTIADGAIVSGATTVFESIVEPGMYTGILPAQPHREWQKNAVQLRHLAQLRRRVAALEHALARAGGDAAGLDPHKESAS